MCLAYSCIIYEERCLTTLGNAHWSQTNLACTVLAVEVLGVQAGLTSQLPELNPSDLTATVKDDPLQPPASTTHSQQLYNPQTPAFSCSVNSELAMQNQSNFACVGWKQQVCDTISPGWCGIVTRADYWELVGFPHEEIHKQSPSCPWVSLITTGSRAQRCEHYTHICH